MEDAYVRFQHALTEFTGSLADGDPIAVIAVTEITDKPSGGDPATVVLTAAGLDELTGLLRGRKSAAGPKRRAVA